MTDYSDLKVLFTMLVYFTIGMVLALTNVQAWFYLAIGTTCFTVFCFALYFLTKPIRCKLSPSIARLFPTIDTAKVLVLLSILVWFTGIFIFGN